MTFGLETYDIAGNVLSSLDSSIMTYYGGHLIEDNPTLGEYDSRVNRLYLGPESSYVPWVVAVTLTDSPPTLAWDIPEHYIVNQGDYIDVVSSKYNSVYITVGRF